MKDFEAKADSSASDGSRTDELSLVDYLIALWRYRFVIVGTVLATTAVALFATWRQAPTYEATSRLMVSALRLGEQSSPSVNIAAYAALVESQNVVLRGMEELGLTRPPHNVTAGRAVREHIFVQAADETKLISITVRFSDPQIAAMVANKLAEHAVEAARQVNQEEAIAALDIVKVQLDEAQARLSRAEERLESYRREAQLEALTKDVDALLEQRTRLLPLLIEIESEKARIRQTEEELGRHERVREFPRTLTVFPVVPQRAGSENSDGRKPDNRREEVPHKGPPQRKSDDVDSTGLRFRDDVLNHYINPVYEILSHQLSASRTKLSALESQRTQILRVTDFNRDAARKLNELYRRQAEIARLEREAALAREAYLNASKRHEQASLQVGAQRAHLQIVDAAVPPRTPIGPKVLRIALLAGAVSLMLACAAVLLFLIIRPGWTRRHQISA